MKLYQDPRAPNPRRVRIFFAEKGIPLELVEVSIARREHESEEHRARNPLGLVPVLELDDGRRLCESMAICRYVEEIQPQPSLLGETPFEKATIEQWNRHAELELLAPVAFSFRHGHEFWKGRIEQFPEFGDWARRRSLEILGWLDRELATRDWLAGNRFSVADITALAAIDFGRISKIKILPEQEHLQRWYQRVNERPSARA